MRGRPGWCATVLVAASSWVVVLWYGRSVAIADEPPQAVNTKPSAQADIDPRLRQHDDLLAQAKLLYANEKLSDAIVAAEKMLAIDRDLFKDAPAKLADTLEMLAECYWEHDDFDAARKAQQEALDIKINLLGKDHWQVTDARHKLDEYALYQKLYLALMPQQRDRMAEAKKLNRHVIQLYQQGNYAAAVGFAKQVQAICDEIYGREHLVTAISLDNLAKLYNAQGNYSEALPIYQQVLKIREKVLERVCKLGFEPCQTA